MQPACDSHIHVYAHDDAPASVPHGATADDYALVRARIGTQRTVVVTPAVYRTDNRVTLDAIQRLGPSSTRGIAVLHPDVSDATLETLHQGGIRGLRFTLFDPATAVTRIDMVEPLAHRIAPLGWHVQLHLRAQQVAEYASLLERLPGRLVFDHRARLPVIRANQEPHAAQQVLMRLLERGNTWVKLSAPYLDSATGDYSDLTDNVRQLVARAPERMLWGSDWPHPTEKQTRPDIASLRAALARWVPDTSVLERILVNNPAHLYGF